MKATTKVYIHAEKLLRDSDAVRLVVLTHKTSSTELFGPCVLETEITIDVPDELLEESALIAGKVAQLKLAKDKILADAHVKAKLIQDRIDSLLCIEHKQ